MNVFRKVAVAAIAIGAVAPLAGAADKATVAAISGPVKPGVYGRVAMTSTPAAAKPALVYSQPMMVDNPETTGVIEPVYLHVPPEHAKNWKKNCAKYEACNKPVFFIKSAEYEPGYVPPKPEKSEKPEKRKFRSGW